MQKGGPLMQASTRRAPLLLSMSPASCSHVVKDQAPPAAAAEAAAVLTASVSGHRLPGTALLWTKTDGGEGPGAQRHPSSRFLLSVDVLIKFRRAGWIRCPVTESRCGRAPGLKRVSIDPSWGRTEWE